MFWGIILIAVGVIIVINHVFGINLPIIKILFGLFLIYLGLKVIFGSFGLRVHSTRTEQEAIFSESDFKYEHTSARKEFRTIFGKGNLDLTGIDVSKSSTELNLDCIFGDFTVTVSPETPLVVKVNSAFGQVRLPNQDRSAFGEFTYQSDSAKTAEYKLTINANAVFGNLKIQYP